MIYNKTFKTQFKTKGSTKPTITCRFRTEFKTGTVFLPVPEITGTSFVHISGEKSWLSTGKINRHHKVNHNSRVFVITIFIDISDVK